MASLNMPDVEKTEVHRVEDVSESQAVSIQANLLKISFSRAATNEKKN